MSRADRKAYFKAYRLAHKKECAARNKVYRLGHKEEIAAKRVVYYQANKKRLAAYKKTYNLAHQEERAAQKKAYYLAHKEEIAAQQKVYKHGNKLHAATNKVYRKERKERLWNGNIKTQKELLMLMRSLLFQTEKALREGNRKALSLLRKKFEQLPTMVA